MYITPSTVTTHPPETSGSSCCLVIVFSAMIKVSFKALGTLITHYWLHNESQGGSWLRTASFIITSLEPTKVDSSQTLIARPAVKGSRGSAWSHRADICLKNNLLTFSGRAVFSTQRYELPAASFALLSCLSPHRLTWLWCVFWADIKRGSFQRHSVSN